MAPVIPVALPDPAAPSPPRLPRARRARQRLAAGFPNGPGRPGFWLHTAAAGLLVLAAAAAAVSFSAQYRLVYAARRLPAAAAMEAAIPDAAALVFACLGIALALHGRRAVRARLLNAASASASVFMNVIAAAPGWRDVAVWAMPPAAYALASDTLIGVVRTGVLARQGPGNARRGGHRPGGDRRGAVVAAAADHGPGVYPGRVPRLGAGGVPGRPRPPRRPGLVVPAIDPAAAAPPRPRGCRPPPGAAHAGRRLTRGAQGSGPRGGTKTARFLTLVAERHGPLGAAIALGSVGRILGPGRPAGRALRTPGLARTALRRAVLTAQNGSQ